MPFKSETTFNEMYLNDGGSLIPLNNANLTHIGENDTQDFIDTTPLEHAISLRSLDGKEYTFYGKVYLTREHKRLLFGTNNWRKMHHIPMMRKTASERRR